MRILLTGASGFLGRAVMRRLEVENDVEGLSHRQTNARCLNIDLREEESVRGMLGEFAPDWIVHASAYRDPDFCEKNPDEARRLNVDATRFLCRHMPQHARILYISSDYVFSGRHPPYYENSERGPINVYGETKAASEDIVLSAGPNIVLRIPLLVGGGATLEESGFIGKTISAIRGREPQRIDHVGIRFPTWIEDVSEAIDFLLREGKGGVFHCSSLRPGTKYDWTCEIAAAIGEEPGHIQPMIEPGPEIARRPPDSHLAVDKIRAAGFNRFTDFSEVLAHVLKHLK
ncbi:MAG: SDR family oxidoreductase [Verrucomicrobia bacterium]|nr:SDR family oxidoreductase [Verrucomicrobiota bacterium]